MEKDFLVVEEIDGEFAYCENENRSRVKIELKILPQNVAVNDCLIKTDEAFAIDEDLTNQRKKAAILLMKSLIE
ncbi:MAG: DUF3006 domain-containing protein [Oscillospiraceae bacterium]